MARIIYTYAPEWLFDGFTFHSNKIVRVNDEGEIIDIMESTDPVPSDTRRLSGIVLPGLINAHCHIELSHMLGQIPAKTGLGSFLKSVTSFRSPNDAQLIEEAAKKAISAMAETGIVAVGDICNTPLLASLKEPLPLHIHHFVEVFGLHESQSLERFMQSLEVYHTLSQLRSSSMVLHAPYSVSPSLIKLVSDFNRNQISTIHHQESAAEHDLFLRKTGEFLALFHRVQFNPADFTFYGQRSSEAVLEWNRSAKSLLLVHNTFSEEADITAVEEQAVPVYWCLCPKANLYIEDALPNVPLLQKKNQKIVLGTDSLASNNSLNLWEEMHALQTAYPQIGLLELFTWATRFGAEAINQTDQLGTISIGKKPGVLWFPDGNINNPLPKNPTIHVLHGVTSA